MQETSQEAASNAAAPANAASDAKNERRVSRESYSIFFSQTDHLKALLAEQKFDDAAKLYDEQEVYFTSERGISRAGDMIGQVGRQQRDAWETDLSAALQALSAERALSDRAQWPALREAVGKAETAVQAKAASKLLRRPEFLPPSLAPTRTALEGMRERLRQQAVESFLAHDHGGGSFLTAYPIDLPAGEFLQANWQALQARHTQAPATALAAIAKAYPELGATERDTLTAALISRRMAEAGSDIKGALNAVAFARQHGLQPKAIPGFKVAFVQATSRTLLSKGQIDFPAAVEVDLPVANTYSELEAALSGAGADAPRYVMVFDVAAAKASRRVTGSTPMPSRTVIGYRPVPNPAYKSAELDLQKAELDMRGLAGDKAAAQINSATCYGLGCLGALVGQAAVIASEKNIKGKIATAMETLRNTPQTIEEPIYRSYSFTRAEVRATKIMTVNYHIIDLHERKHFKSTFDVVERRSLQVAYNVDPADPQREAHIAAFTKEEELQEWEIAPQPVRLSQLMRQYMEATEQTKPLADLAALRAEMTADRAQALAKLADEPEQRPLNDPRFDHVVKVYRGRKGGHGSGFFVSSDVVLTNWHVVDGTQFVELMGYDKQESFGRVIAQDIRLDLALVRVQSRGKPVRFYSGRQLDLGRTVEAIGHPQGLDFSVTRGVVSAVRPMPNINLRGSGGSGKDVLYVQTDAAVNPGNSGGPLFLGDRVVGVNTWGRNDATGLNFSVHYSEVLNFLKENLPGFTPAMN
ncbi:S1C family serine protease [Ferrovibrio sp.]|uniref:S1C family serine protease n=1 Tax=Ferrovibrio sp. TaxID=1917215 RepID=UPI0035B38FC3